MITREKLGQLEPGMAPQQVRFLMGTPMLRDPFHADRWDYYYSMQSGGELVARHGVTLHFADERLARIEPWGDIPEKEFALQGSLQEEERRGLWDTLRALF